MVEHRLVHLIFAVVSCGCKGFITINSTIAPKVHVCVIATEIVYKASTLMAVSAALDAPSIIVSSTYVYVHACGYFADSV